MKRISSMIKALLFAVASFALATGATAGEMAFEHVMTIGSSGAGEGQFKYVEDFAFTTDGKLLVTDAAHAWVQVFDKTTGEFITRFGGKGDDDENLAKPEGVSVAPNGNSYIADYNTGEVKIYGPDHQWKQTFSEVRFGTRPEHQVRVHGHPLRPLLHAGSRQSPRQRVGSGGQLPVPVRRQGYSRRPDE